MKIEDIDVEGYVNRVLHHASSAEEYAHHADGMRGISRSEALRLARGQAKRARTLLDELCAPIYELLAEHYQKRASAGSNAEWKRADAELTELLKTHRRMAELRRTVKTASGCATRGCDAHDQEKAREYADHAKQLRQKIAEREEEVS